MNKTSNFKIKKFIRILFYEPLNHRNRSIALIRGTLTILYYRIFKPKVIIHFPFLAFYKVRIMGLGSVSIGENCWIEKNVFQGLTIVTFSKKAKVIIGKDCVLGGTTIRCFNEVKIGDKTIIANSLIQDAAFCEISMAKSLSNRSKMTPLPISIGKNVWVGMATCILGGTILGNDSVISLGSTSYKIKINEYRMATGNPVIGSLQIENILNLLKK